MFCLINSSKLSANNLNFHWRRRWWDRIQAIFLNLIYSTWDCSYKIWNSKQSAIFLKLYYYIVLRHKIQYIHRKYLYYHLLLHFCTLIVFSFIIKKVHTRVNSSVWPEKLKNTVMAYVFKKNISNSLKRIVACLLI